MTSERKRTEIDFAPLRGTLEQPLGLVSDPQRSEELQTYINAAWPHLERGVYDLLSQLVDAFNDANPEQRAHLEYGSGRLHLAVDAAENGSPETTFSDSDLEKVTLRLPKDLKELIDQMANRYGISANNWYVRELSRTIARQVHHGMKDAIPDEMRDARRRGFYRGRGNSLRGFVGGVEDN
jgi:predicted HicB family RNase H-like nuclease